MQAIITIQMDNAAFADEPATELARILRELADAVENGSEGKRLLDINGNGVGQFYITD